MDLSAEARATYFTQIWVMLALLTASTPASSPVDFKVCSSTVRRAARPDPSTGSPTPTEPDDVSDARKPCRAAGPHARQDYHRRPLPARPRGERKYQRQRHVRQLVSKEASGALLVGALYISVFLPA